MPPVRSRTLTTLIVVLVATAGCIGATQDDGPPDDGGGAPPAAAFQDPIVDAHNHTDWREHAKWTPTMEKVGYTPLGPDGTPFSYIGEVDAHGDHAYVQVIGRGSTPGFVVVDVSDPAAPAVVGRAEMPASYVVDVKVDDDGDTLYAASQNLVPTGTGVPDDPRLFGARVGVAAWDVSDKANPRLMSVTPVEPDGCHMLSHQVIGGTEYVFCIYNTVVIFQVVEDPVTGDRSLAAVATYAPQDPQGTGGGSGSATGATPHDMTVQQDPLDPDRWLMTVSHWDMGVRVVDVTNPRAPVELGAWTGQGAEHYHGYVHSAMATTLNGERVIVATPETLESVVPAVWILDASDLGSLELAAEWTAPGMHESQGLLLTTHQFQLVDGRMYMAYNHAGVWVLDLHRILAGDYAEDDARPEVLGYYLPHENATLYDGESARVPNTWDVNVKDGLIYATDRYTGLYVLHYRPDTVGDPALTGFA